MGLVARAVAKPQIHPRIRQRRVAVTKAAGLQRLRAMGLVAGVGLTAAGLWGLTRSPLLDIDEVRVLGAEQTAAADVIRAGDLAHGTPLVDIDLSGSASLVARLPWVQSARVERLWPGTVVVTVAERQPVAGVARPDGGWTLVSADGRVLADLDGPPAGLPHIHDAEGVPQPGQVLGEDAVRAVTVAAALPQSLRRVVGGLNLRPGGVEMALSAGGVVRLGRPDRELGEKLRAAATVIGRVGADAVGVLDVSVPRAPVLTRR